jgi:cyclophilin family peptidyl-prolyl cis-trans isomerase/phosphoribosylformimino-5-aminoimidazole carboxamide ribonucleotide (ProFAR) isomerase
MQVIPAIDLEAGRSRIVYWPGAGAGIGAPTDRPDRIAERFVAMGAGLIHLVDFDGARAGAPVNLEAVGSIAARIAVPLQLAGGVESEDAIRLAFASGATRVVLTTAIADRPDDLRACLAIAGDWLAVGLDPRPERLAAFPWRRDVPPTVDGLVGELVGAGVARFVLSHGGGEPTRVNGLPRVSVLTLAAVIVVLVVAGALLVLRPGAGGGTGSAAGSPANAGSGACPKSQPAALPAGETRTVTITTPKGAMTIKLVADLSPIAVGNFAALVSCGFYDGTPFHRTAKLQDGTPFVIQGGDPTGTGTGGPGYTITDEPVSTPYKRGTVAMARSNAPNSVGSQFFIVLDDKDGAILGGSGANNYQIIGSVTSGMETADAILAASAGVELPTTPIRITTATIANP